MKKTILVAACVAAISAFTAVGASARVTGPQGQQTMKTNDPMNSNARMRHHSRHHMHKGMMKGEGMDKGGMKGGGMKDGMKKDGMSK